MRTCMPARIGYLAVMMLALHASTALAAPWPFVAPKTSRGPLPAPHSVMQLAEVVTELENRMREFGSITVKQPDVWGETNLMSYIQEYEKQMRRDVEGDFKMTLQGFTATSDVAQLASSTGLGIGTGVPGSTTKTSITSSATEVTSTPGETGILKITDPATLAAFDAMGKYKAAKLDSTFEIEPTELTRQHSVFMGVNQHLRRINMGDDNSRSAGYALYKVRVPISVLPGRKTYHGHCAVVNLQAHLVIDANHLRFTFPKIVAADIGSVLAQLMHDRCKNCSVDFNSPCCQGQSGAPATTGKKTFGSPVVAPTNPLVLSAIGDQRHYYSEEALHALCKIASYELGAKCLNAFQPSDLQEFMFQRYLQIYLRLRNQGLFDEESPAVDVIARTQQAIATGQLNLLDGLRCEWKHAVCSQCQDAVHVPALPCDNAVKQSGAKPTQVVKGVRPAAHLTAETKCPDPCPTPDDCEATWILAVQMAIANQNITELIESLDGHVQHLDRSSVGLIGPRFYVVNGATYDEAAQVWDAMIRQRFPIHVFALDPVFDEQNILDASSRVRQMQAAVAIALANGNINANQAIRFTRTVERDVATIALNRMIVGFAHGDDTFGWYFYPRTQTTVPERSNIAAIARLVWSGGPTWKYDARNQRLEAGIRECEALLVMPGFVNGVRFDVTTNWEKLAHPGVITRDYVEMVDQGSQVQRALAQIGKVRDQQCHRAADFTVLASRIAQLEKMLPLQSIQVRIPFEYSFPAGELFDTGNSHLRPRITGYYGSNSIATAEEADLFIVGNNFHPTQTRVIVSGGEVPWDCEVQVMSRELLKVRIPRAYRDFVLNHPGDAVECSPVNDANGDRRKENLWAEIRVGTPAGISNKLLINLHVSGDSPKGYVQKSRNPCSTPPPSGGSGGGSAAAAAAPTVLLPPCGACSGKPCPPGPAPPPSSFPPTSLPKNVTPPQSAGVSVRTPASLQRVADSQVQLVSFEEQSALPAHAVEEGRLIELTPRAVHPPLKRLPPVQQSEK